MEPEIKEMKGLKIIGLQCQTQMGKTMQDLPKLWDEFMARMNEIKNRIGKDVAYGVSTTDDPTGQKFYYLAGIEVSDDSAIPHDMTSMKIAAKKYAVFIHKGPVSKIGETYEVIFNEWLPSSRKNVDMKAPHLERYDERFKDDENSVMEILVPLKS